MQIHAQDVTWNASVFGEKHSLPLVLLHGFAQSANSFALHVPVLSKRFRIICVDLPGHGGTSEPAALHWPMLCNNLHDAVAQIESRSSHWFGYSQGGRVALMCALAKPERVKSLALLGASAGIADAGERELRRQSDRLLGQNIVGRGMAWFADYWDALPIFATQKYLPEPIRRLIRNERLSCTPQGLKFALETYGTGTMPDCFKQLCEWTKPLFLAAGALDTKFVQSNARFINVSQSTHFLHHVFQNCGHAAHLEQPEQFTKLLIDFIHAAESKTV